MTALALGASAAPPSVEFEPDDAAGQLRVLIGGREAFAYVYGTNVDLAHFYPLRSPSGQSMTVQRAEPYPHHRSFGIADTVQLAGHREASFYNAFYTGRSDRKNPQPPFRDRIRHVAFTQQRTDRGRADLGMLLRWEMDEGRTPVLEETRRLRIVALDRGEYFLDLHFAVRAAFGEVTFRSDAVHYAWPFLRLNERFNTNGGGVLVNSEGARGQAGTNLKPARWVDFSRPDADGAPAEGVAIFSHPSNPHPHAWLTRDYGCFGPRRPDDKNGVPFVLKSGESLAMRVGVLVHRGDVTTGRVAERYQAWANGKL